jgi:hypothetical protein
MQLTPYGKSSDALSDQGQTRTTEGSIELCRKFR